jgi:hypothetical protein
MGKSKLGRKRKYSHQKYNNKSKGNYVISAERHPYSGLPFQFQFSLRGVPLAVLNEPSIYNYSHVFSVLSIDKALSNQWNLVKHSELFLMLSTFTTKTSITPIPGKTVIVNTDFTWRLTSEI